jgi:hypothetical protein
MKLRFSNPTISIDLTKSGKVDEFQSYLQTKAGAAWVGFSLDFGNGILQIDTDSDNAALLFAEFGEYVDITNVTQEELENYLLEQMGG